MKINILILGLLITLQSCSVNYHIESDFDDRINSHKYSTYSIYSHNDHIFQGIAHGKQEIINKLIDKEMKNLGFRKVDKNADLVVSWFVKIKSIKELEIYHDYYNRWLIFPEVSVLTSKQGTIVFDFVDREESIVLWHGKTSSTVYDETRDVDFRFKKVVNQVFNQFTTDLDWYRQRRNYKTD